MILPLICIWSHHTTFHGHCSSMAHTLWIVLLSTADAAAKSLQSCPTLCDPIDGSPPGSPGPGILQARTLEWIAVSFSNAWKLKVKVKSLSRVQCLATPWIAANQAPLPMGFSRQEYWSGVPLPSPVLLSKSEQIHLLPIAVSHWILGNETSRAWASWGPKIRHRGFWLGSSPSWIWLSD